jgi:hypothetical protein
MNLYIGPIEKNLEDPWMITYYANKEIKEWSVKPTNVVGPVKIEDDEGPDIVFTIADLPGLFVTSKKTTAIYTHDEPEEQAFL